MIRLNSSWFVQKIEIVVTAHPTQTVQRSLQYKHCKIAQLLSDHDVADKSPAQRDTALRGLFREVMAIWQTDELRRCASVHMSPVHLYT